MTIEEVTKAKAAAEKAASKALHKQAAKFAAQRKALEAELAKAQAHVAKLAKESKKKDD